MRSSAILTADACAYQQGKPKPVRRGAPASNYLDIKISYALSEASARGSRDHALRISSHVTQSRIA